MSLKKKFAIVLTIAALMAGVTVGCTKQANQEVDESGSVLVARVNGDGILKDAYDQNFDLMENAYNKMFGENIWTQEIAGRPVKEIVREELLENMIRERVITAYVKDSGYKVDPTEVQEAYDNFQDVLNTDKETKEFYEEKGLGDDFIRAQIESRFYMEEFNNMIRKDVEADEETLNSLYETEKVLLNASHILVKDDATATLIEEKLAAGEDFAELATEYSQDPGSASNGGSLGYFGRGKMVPEFEDVAFGLEVGEVSEPVKSQFGFHIIKIEDVQTIRDLEATGASEEEIETYKTTIVDALVKDVYEKNVEELIGASQIERFLDDIEEE